MPPRSAAVRAVAALAVKLAHAYSAVANLRVAILVSRNRFSGARAAGADSAAAGQIAATRAYFGLLTEALAKRQSLAGKLVAAMKAAGVHAPTIADSVIKKTLTRVESRPPLSARGRAELHRRPASAGTS